jgi:HSP20 family protein
MQTIEVSKDHAGTRGLRDRWPWKSSRRHPSATTADIAARTAPTSDWEPLRLLRDLLRWDSARWLAPAFDHARWQPPCEVRENAQAIRICLDVPGLRREAVSVSITGTRLVVAGEREVRHTHSDEIVHADERPFGRFTRCFTLSEVVDFDHVTSELRDGVLTVIAPFKSGQRSRKVQVDVTSATS